MRGIWTSVGSMYLGREMPLFFLLLSNPHSSKTISADDKTHPTFSTGYAQVTVTNPILQHTDSIVAMKCD